MAKKIKTDNQNENRKSLLQGNDDVFFPAAESLDKLPLWYKDLFDGVKSIVSVSRRNTMMLANANMMMTYYNIGKLILERQSEEGWGAKVIDRLSYDLKQTFPEQKGFSPRNLKYMRRFAQIWPDEQIVQRSVAQFSPPPLPPKKQSLLPHPERKKNRLKETSGIFFTARFLPLPCCKTYKEKG